MEEFRIVVRFDTRFVRRGLRVVDRRLVQMERRAFSLGRALRAAFAAISAGLAVRGIVRAADAFLLLQNRISVVIDNQQQLAAATNEVIDIATRSRQPLDAIAKVYQRIALNAGEIGITQGEALRLTEDLAKATAISGAGAAEASAGLIQFTQGLASGELRGQELRSVLEQIPFVAQIIAKDLGLTIDELREFGFEGNISAEVIIGAFRRASDEINERFAKRIPTVAEALQNLRTRFVQFIGELSSSSGAGEGLARTIESVSESFDELAVGARLFFDVMGELTSDVVPAFGEAFRQVGEALESITGETQFVDQMAVIVDRTLGLFVGLGDAVRAIFVQGLRNIVLFGRSLVDAYKLAFLEISVIVNAFVDATLHTFSAVGGAATRFISEMGVALEFLRTAPSEAAGRASEAVVQFEREAAGLGSSFVTSFENAAKRRRVEFTTILGDPDSGAADELFENGADIGKAFIGGFQSFTLSQDILGDFRERLATAQADAEGEAARREGVLGRAQPTLEDSFAKLGEVLPEAAQGFDVYGESLDRVAEKAGNINTVQGGLVESFKALNEGLLTAGELTGATFDRLFGGATEVIDEFVETGKVNISSLFDSIIKDLAKLALQQGLIALLTGGAGSGGSGGIAGLIPGLFGGSRQAGGPVSAGRIFRVNEGGTEVFAPSQSGRIVPAGQTAALLGQPGALGGVGGAGAAPQVNIRNVIEGDDEDEREGEVLNIISRNRRRVKQSIA